MAINLKKLSHSKSLLTSGHRACVGCTAPSIFRQILLVAGPDTVCCCATGCMEVVTTIYPFTAWNVPFIHNAFENAAATITGAETAYRSLKKQGKIKKKINFIAFGGDGGTYDIGLQSLSGALERGHNFLYVCYDNEAYMNTGIQRSGATPRWAATMTTPVGSVQKGKREYPKDLTAIVVAHEIPYAAQASPHNFMDLTRKVEKALSIEGPKFMNVITSCNRGWRTKVEDSLEVAKLAVETCFWPLYEVEYGAYKITYKPKEKLPVEEFLKTQGRFKHLFKDENKNMIKKIQDWVDKRWEDLLLKEKITQEQSTAGKAE